MQFNKFQNSLLTLSSGTKITNIKFIQEDKESKREGDSTSFENDKILCMVKALNGNEYEAKIWFRHLLDICYSLDGRNIMFLFQGNEEFIDLPKEIIVIDKDIKNSKVIVELIY